MRYWMIVTLLVATSGCTVRQDLGTGQEDGGYSGQQDGGPDGPGWGPDGSLLEQPHTCALPPDAAPSTPVIAVWEGYAQNAYPSGSDSVKVTLHETTSTVSGTIVFGSGTPPPFPTMSNECYPQNVSSPANPVLDTLEGFEYPIVDGIATATRLKVAWLQRAPWKSWCECQTSYFWYTEPGTSDEIWNCMPAWGTSGGYWDSLCQIGDPQTSQTALIPCCQEMLCGGIYSSLCACTANGCTNHPTESTLDCAVIGDQADCDGIHLVRTH